MFNSGGNPQWTPMLPGFHRMDGTGAMCVCITVTRKDTCVYRSGPQADSCPGDDDGGGSFSRSLRRDEDEDGGGSVYRSLGPEIIVYEAKVEFENSQPGDPFAYRGIGAGKELVAAAVVDCAKKLASTRNEALAREGRPFSACSEPFDYDGDATSLISVTVPFRVEDGRDDPGVYVSEEFAMAFLAMPEYERFVRRTPKPVAARNPSRDERLLNLERLFSNATAALPETD